jgi:dTMP kinase
MFIAFEGIDGSGKSTQARLLFEYMKRTGKCVFTDEPTSSMTGVLIHDILRSKKHVDPMALQLLFISDRAEHVNGFIIPKLKSGYSVITDRYMFSTIAYGAASGLDAGWLTDANSKFILPDATFVCDLDPKTAMQRIKKRSSKREYFEKLRFLTRARAAFKSLAKSHRNCFLIDSSRSVKEINSNIIKIVNSL